MNKIFCFFILFIQIFSCAEAKPCAGRFVLAELTATDSTWVVVREKAQFKPILRLAIIDSVVWVTTYGADGFPVRLKHSGSGIFIENIIFRRKELKPQPGSNLNLLGPYRSNDVTFQLKLPANTCSLEKSLLIEISDPKKSEVEILNFNLEENVVRKAS